MAKVVVVPGGNEYSAAARELAAKLGLEWKQSSDNPDFPFYLKLSDRGLELCDARGSQTGPIRCDFARGALHHRRLFGGGRRQDLSKAVGLHRKYRPSILDVTAGLGRDAFIFASLGAIKVTMFERQPAVYALLRDGLLRAERHGKENDAELLDIVSRMDLQFGDAHEYLEKLKVDYFPDVIYLDPMYPPRSKSARVKKEMEFFHDLVGRDEDSAELLELALSRARYRVVVKRPANAAFLADKKAAHQVTGKNTRFDLYTLKAMPLDAN